MQVYVGNIYPTNTSGKLEVIKHINSDNVEVKFIETGYITETHKSNVVKGSVKDKLFPSVFGVGFIGVGRYIATVKGKQTKVYQCWHTMLSRCYSSARQKKHPTYIGCTVHPDWHNFQVFAKWYDKNYPADGGDYHLDKDIKIDGNKEYSPIACMFVSQKENLIKATAKSYTFKNPNGDIVEIYNLLQFCRDNGLNQRRMWDVHSGKRSSHKRWTK